MITKQIRRRILPCPSIFGIHLANPSTTGFLYSNDFGCCEKLGARPQMTSSKLCCPYYDLHALTSAFRFQWMTNIQSCVVPKLGTFDYNSLLIIIFSVRWNAASWGKGEKYSQIWWEIATSAFTRLLCISCQIWRHWPPCRWCSWCVNSAPAHTPHSHL